jgi:hypothetical protein
MAKLTVTHEIDCDADTFWKTFFDRTFNEKLFLGRMGFAEHRVLDQRETDTEIVRRVAATPKLSMPGPVAKLIGDNFRYTEEGVFDRGARVWRWKVVPSVQADKLRTEGVVRAEPIGSNRVRRVSEATIEARIFGIGGLVESSAEKTTRQSWDDSAAFMNEYLRSLPR